MSEPKRGPWHVELTREQSAGAFMGIAWFVISMIVAMSYPRIGFGLLMLGAILLLVNQIVWARRNPEANKKLIERIRENERKPLARVIRYSLYAILAYIAAQAIVKMVT